MTFFIRFQDDILNVDGILHLVDFFVGAKEENGNFTLRKRSFQAIDLECRRWHKRVRQIKSFSSLHWEGSHLQDCVILRKHGGHTYQYRIKQIRTAKGLVIEGNAMRHCVGSYANSCASGRVSIWSMTKECPKAGVLEKRCVTIEVYVNNGTSRLGQISGYGNRSPRADEMSVINEWKQNWNASSSYGDGQFSGHIAIPSREPVFIDNPRKLLRNLERA